MASGVPYALLTLFCFGLNDLLFKRAAQHGAASHQMMMVFTLTMLPFFAAYGVLTRSVVPDPAALWGSLGGLFAFFGFYNFSRSLSSGAVSVLSPIFRLQFVVTAVLALVLLGEYPSVVKIAGLLLAIAAVWLLQGSAAGAKVEVPREAIARVLLATVAVGIAFFLFKLALRQGATPASVLLCQVVALASASTALSVHLDRGLAVSPAALRYGIPFGVSQAIGFGALIEGLAIGEASILVPIAQLSFVITAIVGLTLLKEAVTARKSVGLAAAVGAVALLAFAARLP
ncbi:MAG: EamA family transporter [Burkholderiales bacterium]